MIPLLTKEVATNIAHHTQLAWTYSVPNDTTGEIILTCGLKPFYPEAEQKGGSTTIVDVKVGNIAYDVKCRKVLKIFKKARTEKQKANAPGQVYHKINDNLYIGKPTDVLSPVRRPKVNLENFQGDSKRIITKQIEEYKNYANRTMQAAGCNELRSLLILYGKGKGYKSIYIEEQSFSTPAPVRFEIYINEKNKPAGYIGYDNKPLYKLSNYSKGSSNFNKRFDCNTGFIFVWADEELSTDVVTPDEWQLQGNHFLSV